MVLLKICNIGWGFDAIRCKNIASNNFVCDIILALSGHNKLTTNIIDNHLDD